MVHPPLGASTDPTLRNSGNCQDVRANDGTATDGATINDANPSPACRTYRYLVELVCMLCSREVGTTVVDQPQAPVSVPRQLRCQYCGGQPLAGETDRKVVYSRVLLEQPRRGRPPRWLVEQRGQEKPAR